MRVTLLPPYWRFAVGACFALLLSGCQHSSPLSPAVPVSQRTTVSSAPAAFSPAHVQSLPLYRQAESACQRKQYAQAATLLSRLATDTTLSAQERAFCREQQAICLRDAGLPVPAYVASTLPAASPVTAAPAHPLTPEQADCGPRALHLVCQRLGVSASVSDLRKAAGTTGEGTTMAGLTAAAKGVGLKAEGVQVSREALARVEMPALAWVNQDHYVAVLSISGEGESGTAVIHDPNAASAVTIPQEQLLRLCGGYLLLVHR